MYVTTHRVRTGLGADGINAYLYMHGDDVGRELPVPDADPGTLVNSLLSVDAVGGNRVRSFLDIVAPDWMFWPQIRPSFMQFVREMQPRRFTWVAVVGACWFRVSFERSLIPTWPQEIASLYRACEMVHPVLVP